ncbi:MAG: phytochelatin synthase family protein [Prochlorotrichaceae cyanobacterium]|jgi:hypothetical protein
MKLPRSLKLLLQGTIGLTLAVSSPFGLSDRSFAQPLPLTENLIAFPSEQGKTLLRESDSLEDFVPLSSHFVTQENQAYCGIASITIVLNALGIEAPIATAWNQNYFTQDNVLNADTEAIIPASLIQRQGLTLAELAGILEQYPLQVDRYHGATISLAEFRQLIVENLAEPDNYVLINYLRKTIGQERGGHISPIAAYHAESDRFLVLDVSRYKYPPVWVKAEELWQATNTIDSVSGETRGILLIKKK